MIISTVHSQRKNMKWCKKYFFHLIDICVRIAYCLYKIKTGKDISMTKFHLRLIRQLLSHYLQETNNNISNKSRETSPLRLTGRHFLSLYTSTTTKRKIHGKNALHVQKNDRRSKSRCQWQICDVGLYVIPCFVQYYTLNDY